MLLCCTTRLNAFISSEDELQPDVEQISPESSDNEDDASEAESGG